MTDGYQPDFDIDREFGNVAEETVRDLLRMNGDRLEVKHKRYEDWAFYVETAQSPQATGKYKASGINVTDAEYWAYEINGTGIVVFIPTALLKDAANRAPQKEETDGDNPTKGRLVRSEHLFPPENPGPEVPWD